MLGAQRVFLVKAFSEIGIEARGIDVSEYAIANSPADIKSMLYKIDLNYDTLPFKDEEFDFITFIWTMQYITNWEHAIKELKRVTKKMDIFIFQKFLKEK
jgi:ubiquinone/menaquinone biosynthesis C-methylase UbiE